jgi:predicted CoA-binding protein
MEITTLGSARAFLALPRFALVGVERAEGGFSRMVFRELLRRGLDVVPVNPALQAAEGRRAFARVQDIEPSVQGALLMTPASRTADVVRDCLAAGVRHLWLHQGAGAGSASPEALALCQASGLTPVTGLCPFMAFPDAGWFHRLHRLFRGAR